MSEFIGTGDSPNESIDEAVDPWEPQHLSISHFITTARCYDVLLAILTHLDPAVARDLMELHMSGALMGPQPVFNGIFVSDEVNNDEPESEG